MSLVEESRVDTALRFLAETDREVAAWRGSVLRTEYMAKCAEALAYKVLEGSIEDRKQASRLDENVKKAWSEHFDAVVAWEQLKAKREREFIIIELYRTEEASRRKGNI